MVGEKVSEEYLRGYLNMNGKYEFKVRGWGGDGATLHVFSWETVHFSQTKGVFGYTALKFSLCLIECLNLHSGYYCSFFFLHRWKLTGGRTPRRRRPG